MNQEQPAVQQQSPSEYGCIVSETNAKEPASEYVDFWNDVLVPKFITYKHILVDGLTHHSAAIFPSLPVKQGDKVLDIGCGFGDTAVRLAERVGPTGEVTGGISAPPTRLDRPVSTF